CRDPQCYLVGNGRILMARAGVAQFSGSKDREENLAAVRRLTERAAEHGVNLLCFHELANTIYPPFTEDRALFALAEPESGSSVSQAAAIARQAGILMVYPFFERDGEHYYNSAIIFGRRRCALLRREPDRQSARRRARARRRLARGAGLGRPRPRAHAPAAQGLDVLRRPASQAVRHPQQGAALMEYNIGVDIGGTFTDCVVVDRAGKVTIGKALPTPDDFALGTVNAVRDAAANLGVRSERELLEATRLFFHGCTVGD